MLLARRGKALGHGLWSLPGGKLDAGETALDAAHRELFEETGITANLVGELGDFRINTGTVTYLITCYAGHHLAGEAIAASDSDAVAWVAPENLVDFTLAPNTAAAIQAARKLLTL